MTAPVVTAPVGTQSPTSRAPSGRAPGPPRPGATGPGHGNVLAEGALVMLTVAAAVDLSRLFQHRSKFLGPVLLTALAVHGVCWLCRRNGLGLAVAAVGSVVAAALMVSWTLFPHHLAYGIPWRATVHEARLALSSAMQQFRTAAPPTPIATGFTLAGAAGCGAVAFLGDWAAFRMRATVEACLPSLSVFVFSSALAQGHGAPLAAGVSLAAVLAFLLVREAGLERPGPAWFASRAGRGPVALLQAGSLLAVIALVVGLVVGPHLPGATTHSLVSWRHHTGTGGGGRTTGSPLVDIRSRLGELSQTEAFTVSTESPAYWRLTSLDSFDGNGWSLNDTYRHAGGSLVAPAQGQALSNAVTATFSVSTLNSIWLPAAYRPVHYNGPGKVSFSSDAGSLIADRATSDGLTYSVQSSVPAPDLATLQASPQVSNPTDPSVARDLQLPAMPPLVATIAHEVTSGASTPYEKARLLQDYFRSPAFTYDLNIPAYDGTNAIVAFLQQKRGFCQQFAATYAAMARLVGLPTRVAVGFTQGNPGSDGKLHVLDANAHAWPEVYFAGIGWVAFEPTPGRGAPGAQAYTGVPPQQATDAGSPTATTLPVTATTVPGGIVAITSPPTHFSLDTPAATVVGKPFSVTVTARDARNRAVTTFHGLVTLSSSDTNAAFGTNRHDFTSGVFTFGAVTLKTPGSQTLTATSEQFSGTARTTVRAAVSHRSLWPLLARTLLTLTVLAVLLAALPVTALVRRSRRRSAATTPEAKGVLAWTEVREELSLVGAPPGWADTPSEYARRATSRVALPADAVAAVNWLADYVVRVSYAPDGASSPEESAMAEEASRVVTTAVTHLRTRWQRILDTNRRALSRNGSG